ncbi:SRPBCC domain-containing protein [Nocardioides sp. STR2]|uniref:SRPBCC domain-containing protein n=1 Tax=Nocardioides pini TaxID=2975053 RepID=A0ABT4CHR2_9ACTN|nr:SRPBCC domain-containing protein [Nocardioides pini]MCY4728503.1 SRPBCC domain-containing protein [Nocardioides pini]
MPRIDRAVADVDASPAEVYAAFVDADALASWLPPGGMTGAIADADLRAGGGFTMTLRYDEAPDGGGKTTERSDVSRVAIDELVEPERVVWGVEFDTDDPDTAGRMTMTWTFTARDTGTRVAIDATDVPPGIDVEAHQQGLDASLANLTAWLAG